MVNYLTFKTGPPCISNEFS